MIFLRKTLALGAHDTTYVSFIALLAANNSEKAQLLYRSTFPHHQPADTSNTLITDEAISAGAGLPFESRLVVSAMPPCHIYLICFCLRFWRSNCFVLLILREMYDILFRKHLVSGR